MSNWSDFWLNEGFTMFLQRKIIGAINNENMGKISAMIGMKECKEAVTLLGESNDFTSIHPNLIGISQRTLLARYLMKKDITFYTI